MQSLIIDLRGNPGGLLQASVDAADRFLTDGKIVSTVGRKPSENFEYQAHRSGTWSIPLLVLVDHDSASASEIFAGAIQDQHRGRIVGETSYGKGSVQGIFHMHSCNVGLCVTTAKFYSPSGREINRRGITPDEEVTEESLLAANGNPPVTVLRPDLTQAKSATVTAVEPTGEQSRDLVLEHAVGLARQAVAAQPNAPAQLNGRVVTRRP